MTIAPTRFSRVSVGFLDSANSIVAKDPADTGAAFSVTGDAAFDEDVAVTGDLAVTGTLTLGGGTALKVVKTSLTSLIMGSIAGLDSTSTTVAFSGGNIADVVLVTPAQSNWSGAYYDLDLAGAATSANTVDIIIRNSAATAIDPDDTSVRVTLLDFT